MVGYTFTRVIEDDSVGIPCAIFESPEEPDKRFPLPLLQMRAILGLSEWSAAGEELSAHQRGEIEFACRAVEAVVKLRHIEMQLAL